MKKYMIRCDIEGVSGVVSYQQADPAFPEYAFGKRMFMHDLLALLRGLNDGGAGEITVYDEHFYGRNIEIDALPENVRAICGKPPYRADWAGGLDETFSGLILLGFHSKAGTGELLHHSYEPDIADITINGVSVGEIGVEAAIAGDRNVPLTMVIADSAGVREAETLVPGTVGVAVKRSLSPDGGLCDSAETTGRKIREAAARIVRNPPPAKPWKLSSPTLEVHFHPGEFAEKFLQLFGEPRFSASSVTACWAQYWQRKLQTFEALK